MAEGSRYINKVVPLHKEGKVLAAKLTIRYKVMVILTCTIIGRTNTVGDICLRCHTNIFLCFPCSIYALLD